MTLINFPSSPSLNDTYSVNGQTWRFDGTAWVPNYSAQLDLGASGGIKATLTAGATLAAGDLCYMAGDGNMELANAGAEATCDTLLAICLESLSDTEAGEFLLFGNYTTSGLTAGSNYYVHTTAGDWTATAPTGTGKIVRLVGTAISTTVLFFNPDQSYIELS